MERRMAISDGAFSLSTGFEAALSVDPGFPFRSELSLAPLIRFWTRPSGDAAAAPEGFARFVADAVGRAPELLRPIHDPDVLARHQDVIDLLMTAVFPPATRDQEYGTAMVPFRLRAFHATPPARRLFIGPDGNVQGRVSVDAETLRKVRLASAYGVVLRHVYGLDLELDIPRIFTVVDPDTGLDRHFRMLLDWQFIDVETLGPVPELTAELRQRLRDNLLEPDRLRELIPPDRFVLRGLTVMRALDVTDQEVLSALKRDLIHRESVVSSARFLGLQQRLRTLFRRPDLLFGLAAIEGPRVLVLNYGSKHEHSCIFADSRHHTIDEFAGSLYARAVTERRPVLVDDLTGLDHKTCAEQENIASGIRTFLCAPLFYQDRVIGTLELSSPRAGDLDARHLPKVYEVLPLFAMAVQRSMDELNSRIQTQIKEKFTAIHPVVEWRFRKAVLDSLEARERDGGGELEPIVFEKVYPLYALSDIRASSTERATAIQADLLAQLRLATDVIEAAHHVRPLPALDQLLFRIGRRVADIEDGLTSGEETGALAFVRQEVESVFEQVQAFGPEVRARVEAYRAALDPRLGTVYRERRRFEDSVRRLTDLIASYIDLEEQAAQGIFPHYFEKQTTDGVDHQLYVGASLLEDGRFDPLYLKSLRLWQLMVVCGIAARADQAAPALPLPLRTAHLVLVQHAPLSIRFRFDEKRFDVDGAYDIRYEIVKKRIDKATVKGGVERVTQPGKIAIVYAQPSEAAEYRGYIEYLQHLGYLGPDVEELELGELQGVAGLRALRVTVTLSASGPIRPVALDLAAAGDGRRAG
jgi:GAF domain-containing protein